MLFGRINPPDEYGMTHFVLEETYPALLTGVHVEAANDTDYNVAFTFLVSNGYIMKEFEHICWFVYTKGQYEFREFCEEFTLGVSGSRCEIVENYLEEEFDELCHTMDLNDFVGYYAEVSVIDLITDPCIDFFRTDFPDKNYEKYCAEFDSCFKDVELSDSSNIPKEINEHLRKLMLDDNLQKPRCFYHP